MERSYVDPQFRHFALRLSSKASAEDKKGPRLTLVCQTRMNFAFCYDDDLQGGFILEGSSDSAEHQPIKERVLKRYKTESNEKRLEDLLADLCSRENVCFSEGIKTYRLFKEDLYNIDLEDKAAYEKLFDNSLRKMEK